MWSVGIIAALICLNYFLHSYVLQRRRQRNDLETQAIRQKHLTELQEEIKKTAKERNYFFITRNELLFDSEALILACHELADVTEEETHTPAFGKNWMEIRELLRNQVSQHNREFSKSIVKEQIHQEE